MFAFEGQFLLYVQEHLRTAWLTPVMTFLSFLGNSGLIWVVLGAALLIFRKTRWAGLCVLLSLLLGFLVNNLLLKNLVREVRPFHAVPGLIPLGTLPTDWSFPSGHACASFAAAAAMALTFGKKGAWCFVLAALIALSRVYVGVHYPSDVLAGALVGTLAAVAVCRGLNRLRRGRAREPE